MLALFLKFCRAVGAHRSKLSGCFAQLFIIKVNINIAIALYLIICIAASSFLVHSLWLRGASSNSRYLVGTLEYQIVDAVKKEIANRIANAESAYGAVRTIFLQRVVDPGEADKREFVFLSQLQSQPTLSAVAFGWPDDGFFTSHKLGDDHLEMVEIGTRKGVWTKRTDRYLRIPGDIEFQERSFERSGFTITKEPWYQRAISMGKPAWFELGGGPWFGGGRAVAFAGAIDIDRKRVGVLATVVEMSRLSRFLGALPVARSGAAYILSSDGELVAGPDTEADELMAPSSKRMRLYKVIERVKKGYSTSSPPVSLRPYRFDVDGSIYDVNFATLGVFGWRAVIIVPEKEFLGKIDETNATLWYAVVVTIGLIGSISAVVGNSLFAKPLARIMVDIAAVGNLKMGSVARRSSRIFELDQLSAAVLGMSHGIDAFSKYVPIELVKTLVKQGIGAVRGGELKPITIMFIDISGFTGMSERMGAGIVPLVNRYFELVTAELSACGGTIDKFIGDSVMAFWGAPTTTPDHELRACDAALRVVRAIERHGILDDLGNPLGIRVGVNTGECVVGNIGAQCHLSYTVIGDPVNVASRLEVANKVYGTRVIIGEATRRAAGELIRVRELDRTWVAGRTDAVRMYELVSMATDAPPEWLSIYDLGVALCRAGDLKGAQERFVEVLRMRGNDQPTESWISRCQSRSTEL